MHVFFDLDGTLTDPKEGFIASIRFALSKLNIEIDSDINLEPYIGPPLQDTLRELCGNDATAKDAVLLYRERYSTIGLRENQLYDGISECLDQITGKAESIFVVTSKLAIIAERIIEQFKLSRYFKVVYGSNFDGSLSDKTELIDHVLRSEGISPRNAVMIGDRSFDIIGAKNNGLDTIGVLWGYGSKDELICAGADELCEHPNEIYDLIFT